MARYEIVVTDDDSHEADRKPWKASVFKIDEDGKSEDALAFGTGGTPRNAARDALIDWEVVTG